MFNVGDSVRVKHPFDEPYAGVYVVERIELVDGDVPADPVYFLVGIDGGFDHRWLEAA